MAAVGLLWVAHRHLAPQLQEALPFAFTGRLTFLGVEDVAAGLLLATVTAVAGVSLATRKALSA